MTDNKLQERVNEYNVAKALVDAAVYLARGMGFTVEAKFESEIGTEPHPPTVIEGLKDVMFQSSRIMRGYKIDPRYLVTAPPAPTKADTGLILPYEGNA